MAHHSKSPLQQVQRLFQHLSIQLLLHVPEWIQGEVIRVHLHHPRPSHSCGPPARYGDYITH